MKKSDFDRELKKIDGIRKAKAFKNTKQNDRKANVIAGHGWCLNDYSIIQQGENWCVGCHKINKKQRKRLFKLLAKDLGYTIEG